MGREFVRSTRYTVEVDTNKATYAEEFDNLADLLDYVRWLSGEGLAEDPDALLADEGGAEDEP